MHVGCKGLLRSPVLPPNLQVSQLDQDTAEQLRSVYLIQLTTDCRSWGRSQQTAEWGTSTEWCVLHCTTKRTPGTVWWIHSRLLENATIVQLPKAPLSSKLRQEHATAPFLSVGLLVSIDASSLLELRGNVNQQWSPFLLVGFYEQIAGASAFHV